MSPGSLRTSKVSLRRVYSSIFIKMAAGRPFFVTMTSSSRSCTPATSSGRRVLTSDNDKVFTIVNFLILEARILVVMIHRLAPLRQMNWPVCAAIRAQERVKCFAALRCKGWAAEFGGGWGWYTH
ncbi:hypothetical protein COMA2_40254 [Candidatus Nitrospira nitrificans]|uniref:Uncharacterized protein n=1 Tax=Candidatus Nitrospira nitrificans TaxID=1742973 RepID=A0A0S4LL65_9BACT|nr:hypothetical protein COMA2_40254 [Candidatus Nitrospira nitrificans]